MWERLFELFKSVLTISVKVERHEKEIDTLKAEVRRLSNLVTVLAAQVKNVSDQRQADRDYIQLWIENELLKFERRLPSGKKEKTDEK